MSLTGGEIRHRLLELAARWRDYQGSERAEAQTFLNELFACYGTNRADVARFEEPTGGGFIDLIWPRVCIVEMKRPSQARRLAEHREQALEYWRNAGTPQTPAPRYVVLCAFHAFEVWEPGAVYREPRAAFSLDELPDRLDALLFLARREPVFVGGQEEVTRYAVDLVTQLYAQLQDRRAAEHEVLRDFLLQCVWAMFAEDLQMLPGHMFTRILDDLHADPRRSSADDLGQLFRYLSAAGPRPAHGVYAGTPYANGGLFARPAHVHLEPDEVAVLRTAAMQFDWKRVEPSIFGSLLQGALGKERQWALGAHFTAEADILEIVRPTIVEPWRERIAACRTLADVETAQHDLMQYVVLDPACGSGNFLYVAYRELRRIEAELRRRASDMRRSAGLRDQQSLAVYFPLSNIMGIEIDPFAVQLARVTLWMGHKLAVDELDIHEEVLPLADLSGIRRGDALALEWPRADAIIGNPPYHGDRMLRRELGDEYVEWLKSQFSVGVKDFCVYWFRKAQDRLADGGRAGLVGTNSISQNRGRSASLDYIVRTGGVIVDAISSKDWSGEAAVDVSIVNWIKNPSIAPSAIRLDGRVVSGVSPSLREGSRDEVAKLSANRGIAFQGMLPGADYVVARELAIKLRAMRDPAYSDIVRPYLSGDDIANDPEQTASRYVVDFGTRTLEEAMQFPAALEVVRNQARDSRTTSTSFGRNPNWWQFLWPRPVFRRQIEGRDRFIAGTATAKRLFFCWCPAEVVASNSTNVFALAREYEMGVLCSAIHERWARDRSSTLENRLRYTPTSAFETFPWPQAGQPDSEVIAELAARLLGRRSAICLERRIGLTRLYNEIDDGAYRDLYELHRELDEAVAAAYGWPASAAHDSAESNRLLLG